MKLGLKQLSAIAFATLSGLAFANTPLMMGQQFPMQPSMGGGYQMPPGSLAATGQEMSVARNPGAVAMVPQGVGEHPPQAIGSAVGCATTAMPQARIQGGAVMDPSAGGQQHGY